MFSRNRITFRRMQSNDMSTMYRWLSNPEVARWYGPAPGSLAEVEAKYEPRISGEVPVDCYIVQFDGRDVAYLQTYLISSEPEYARALDVDRGAAGVDVFIGEDDFRHRGFGPVLLQEFVRREVFTRSEVTCCVIAPTVSNSPAIRAYSKAGFTHARTVPVPDEPEPEYVMMLRPEELDLAIKRFDEERRR
jgi:RimJ/RimL family protein N-acetyltransferase